MARQLFVLALVFVALAGLVSALTAAESPADAPTTATSADSPLPSSAAPGPDDGAIGAIGDSNGDGVAEAPVGGPVSNQAFGPSAAAAGGETPTASPPKSGATTLEVSAIAGVAAIAGFFF